jgi:hypothetical protein
MDVDVSTLTVWALYAVKSARTGRGGGMGCARRVPGPTPEKFPFSYQHLSFGNRLHKELFGRGAHAAMDWWQGVEAVDVIGEVPCRDNTGRSILRKGGWPLGERCMVRTCAATAEDHDG